MKTTMERFVAKTIPADDGSDCLLWTASKLPKGYGIFSHDGERLAHRWIYMQTHGVALGRLDFVLHSCDNPSCVNVDHLRVGTPKENTADMDARGRRVALGPAGERNCKARLTAEQVVEIRARRASGETVIDLASRYGLSKQAISAIATRRNWKHVA